MISKAELKTILKPLSDDRRKARNQKAIQDRLKACTKNADGTYSSEGDVDLSSWALDKLPVKFKEVGGNFFCYDNNLTTLEGAPEEVGGNFSCGYNNLTSLKGAPKIVKGYFSCYNNQLTTLEGSPEEIGDSFICNNNQLTTLEGGPKKVGGDFYCHRNKLTTLEGAPETLGGGYLVCSHNPVSQEELKKTVKREYLK